MRLSHAYNSFLTLAGLQSTLRTPDDSSRIASDALAKDSTSKDVFLDDLVSSMTLPELALQLHLMHADNIVGPNADHALYDYATRFAPGAPVGIIHDWYPTNKSRYNALQKLNSEKSRMDIPMLQYGECLHGVGTYKQSIFPQSIGMSASFDTGLVHKIGRAIGSEARSVGIHACLSPVLDLGLDPRFGRVQEAWGEDPLLTSHMGVAMTSGLSKNGSWSDFDAVAPVVKHFAAYGSSQGGINGAPALTLGTRQLFMDMLRPFKAVIDLGGVRGIMMSYNEFDSIPTHVHPLLYGALDDWGFDGFVTADDSAVKMLMHGHRVADSPAGAIGQWLNAGGMIQYYDFPFETFLGAIIELVESGELALSTIRSHVRRVLGVKHDVGLFHDPYIPEHIEPAALTAEHIPLTLEAAQRSIVLLENRNETLPLKPKTQGIKKIALVGPFADTLNYGDYSGQFGSVPADNANTIRQAMSAHIAQEFPSVELVSGWGTNTWEYNAQYNIPGYLLSSNGNPGGLLATYYSDLEFKEAAFQTQEVPARDWGIYPPSGLPSNNFSVVWEGELTVPVDTDVSGYLGVGLSANTSAKLYIDEILVDESQLSQTGNFLSNIPGTQYTTVNSTVLPPGSAAFKFVPGAVHKIRLEFQAWTFGRKKENTASVNAQVMLFWNLADQSDPVGQAISVAKDADVIILAVGANWNSDGEGGDRADLGLSPSQTALTDSIFALGKPVVMVLQGGRPFAIPEYYAKSAAVITAFFPGQSGGQAISDVLFGKFNPGGRVPLSVPYSAGSLPVFYNYKTTARANKYVDELFWPTYSFGYGLSYTTFSLTSFQASSSSNFSAKDTIRFSVTVTNTGAVAGSYVPQVYLLARVSALVRPGKQLVAFTRVYLDAGESRTVTMELDVDRYLPILDREWNWVLEKGPYTFALLEDSRHDADTSVNVTLTCMG